MTDLRVAFIFGLFYAGIIVAIAWFCIANGL